MKFLKITQNLSGSIFRYFGKSLVKSEGKLKKPLNVYTSFIKSFEMVLNSEQNSRMKNERYRNMNSQNSKKRKPSFGEELVENAKLHIHILSKT